MGDEARHTPGPMPGVAAEPPAIPRGTLVKVLLRSFAVQGSWNYRTLIGTGFAFALLPVFRVLHPGRPDRVDDCARRHSGLFNSHPYIAGIALGGVARLEAEGQPPELIDRFKVALRGSLGTVGDRLVWAGWRPVALLFALLLFLASAPWWVATATFLLLYNAGHVGLRIWSLRLGLHYGLRVGERLRTSSIGIAQRVLPAVGAFLLGALVPLAATGRFVGMRPALPWVAAALGGALLGIRFGAATRTPLALLLALAALLGITLRSGV
jgi:mannose PTS system EIID component